jgi:tRNA U34 5-carboxymethylaminomethyl modifying GTPase MnmE/TrmE
MAIASTFLNDTIVALATPQGTGALGVQGYGNRALDIIDEMF